MDCRKRPARTCAGALLIALLVHAALAPAAEPDEGVRLKELARPISENTDALVGYGIVTGLAGTGDSTRNAATLQSVHNMLLRFGVNVPADKVRTRNSAAVMVTATLPPYAQPGDKLDINVTSLGDARSLVGGTLLLTPLATFDRRIYAMAQGAVLVGGYSYDLNGNLIQKNHPTAAYVPGGASVNRPTDNALADSGGTVVYKLFEPDFATVSRIATALNRRFGDGRATALDAGRIRILAPPSANGNLVRFLAEVESTVIVPDVPARVVVNERTGTVVAGSKVIISPVTITHGNLSVAISTDFFVSQPSFVIDTGDGVRTQVVPDTTVDVSEEVPMSVSLPNGSKVGDLVVALNKVHATSRDIITILQGIKRAGALHAELIIQ
jgi:flagellar P-ring protein FlgI